jgi:uncharacterized membrane protein YhiD involved in acid resistance
MLVGLERECSQKDLGTRTFTIVAMAGTLSVLAAPEAAYVTFAGVLLIILLAGLRNVHEGKAIETTTSAAVIATFVMGIFGWARASLYAHCFGHPHDGASVAQAGAHPF